MLRQILALLLLSSRLNCLDEDDDQPFLQRIDEFRRDHVVPVNETYGFDRMSIVANQSSTVLEFFGLLGHLFVNGTLGYVKEWCRYPRPTACADYIYVSANGSYELRQGVLSLFSDLDGIDKEMDSVSYMQYYPYPQRNLSDAEGTFEYKTGSTFRDILSRSYIYGSFVKGNLANALNMTSAESNTEEYRSFLKLWCTQLNVDDFNGFLADFSRNPILGSTWVMGPECEKVSEGGGVNFMLELLKKDCYKFATNSGFNGGTSNRRVPDEGTQKHTKEFRCFHKFLVRYLDYNMNAYENFVDILSKRLLESVSFYGLCLPIEIDDPEVRRQYSERIVDGIWVIAQQLRNALTVFNETRLTTSTTTTPTTTTSTPTSTTTSTTASSTTDTSTMLTGNTTHSSTVPSLPVIPKPELESVANEVLDVHGIKGQKPWLDRVHLHQTIANETFHNLSSKYANGDDPQIAFQVVVYLPYPKDTSGQHCLRSNKTDYFVEGNQMHGVDYMFHYYRNSSVSSKCLDGLWRKIQEKAPEILDAVFSPDTRDLCKEADEKIRDVLTASPHTDCDVPGVAAVRCGYEFVWYELAYRYFTAARAAGSSFELSTEDTAYKPSCGQVFLFP